MGLRRLSGSIFFEDIEIDTHETAGVLPCACGLAFEVKAWNLAVGCCWNDRLWAQELGGTASARSNTTSFRRQALAETLDYCLQTNSVYGGRAANGVCCHLVMVCQVQQRGLRKGLYGFANMTPPMLLMG
jgi:hypothetical protein